MTAPSLSWCRAHLPLTLAVLLLLLVAGCDGCGGKAATDAGTDPRVVGSDVPFKPIKGDGWSIEIPVDWERGDGDIWIGPDKANVIVTPSYNPLPIGNLTGSTRRDLETRLNKYEVVSEQKGKIGELFAFEINGHYESRAGTPLSVKSVLIDAGRVKYLLTLTVLSADFPNNKTIFDRIVKSFSATYHPVAKPGESADAGVDASEEPETGTGEGSDAEVDGR